MRIHGLPIIILSTLTTQLFASSIELDKITISTPTKFSQSLQDTTANVKVLTADEIKERGFKLVTKALSSISGLNLSRQGGLGQASSLKLRGFESKRVLVLIDGVRYNNPTGRSGAEFSHLLIENIEKIEVIKGPQSGIWGADASAGVINIITKKAKEAGFSASINGEYGSFDTRTYGLNSSYTADKFDVVLNALRVTTDGFSALVPKDADVKDFEDDGYENNSADIKLGFNASDKDRVELFYNIIDTNSQFDNRNPNDANSSVDSKQYFYGLSYVRTEGENQTKIYANRSDFERYYFQNKARDYSGYVDEIGLNFKVEYTKNGQMSAGVDYKNFKLDNKNREDYANSGIFISNSNKTPGFYSGTTIFSQSIRYDKFEKFNNKFTYKLGLKHIHESIEGLVGSVNYATAYNIPSLYQLYSHVGNENLNPEETKGFDVSVNYKGLELTYFSNKVTNMIEYVIENPMTFMGKFYNISDESNLDGVELSYENGIESIDLAYGLNYTYLKAEDKDGKKLLRRPKNSANISLDYYGLSDAHFGTLIQYVGKRDDSRNKKLDSYTVVDFIVDYDITPQFSLYGKIDNLLDEEYQEITGYATSSRAFYMGFRYKIK